MEQDVVPCDHPLSWASRCCRTRSHLCSSMVGKKELWDGRSTRFWSWVVMWLHVVMFWKKHQLLSCHLSPASCCYSRLSSCSWLLPPDGIWHFDHLFLKVLFVVWCCRAVLLRCRLGKASSEITGLSPQLWHWPQVEQLDLYFQVTETFCFLHVSVLESVITHSAKRNKYRFKHAQLQRNSISCCLHCGAWVHLRLSHCEEKFNSSWIQLTPRSATVWRHRVILLWKRIVKTGGKVTFFSFLEHRYIFFILFILSFSLFVSSVF